MATVWARLTRRYSRGINGSKNNNNNNAIELLAKSALATVTNPQGSRVSQKWHNRLRVGLRTFGLWALVYWRRVPEQPKVAIAQDRIAAAIRCLIHLAPVAGTIVLLSLNVTSVFVGASIGPQTTTVLQFVAKLHELLIQASLGAVLFSYIAHHLVSDRGLPFGAAIAGVQLPQLQYLLSPELLGTFRAKSHSRLAKIEMLTVLVVFPLLMSTVGPSTAACMIPRLGPWLTSTQLWAFQDTQVDLYPANITLGLPIANSWNYTGIDSFVSWSRAVIGNRPLPNLNGSVPWTDRNISMPLTLYIQTTNSSNDIGRSYTARSSIQNFGLATVFQGVEPFTLEGAMDAFSAVSCPEANRITWEASNGHSQPSSMAFEVDSIGTISARLPDSDTNSIRENTKLLSTKEAMDFPVEEGIAHFVELPSTDATGIVYATADLTATGSITVTLHPCTATLGWRMANLKYAGQTISSQGLPIDLRSRVIHQPCRINRTSTPLLYMPTSTAADGWVGLDFLREQERLPEVIPLAISIMLTVSLSKSTGSVPNWTAARCNDRTGFCGKYNTKLKLLIYRSGYGYGTELTSVRISLAILMLYCAIALSHSVYAIYSGKTSTAWDSISEFVALGLKSRPPGELMNTTAGIKSAQVFEQKVRIAATAGSGLQPAATANGANSAFEPVGSHLELIFPSTEGPIASRVMANTTYGG